MMLVFRGQLVRGGMRPHAAGTIEGKVAVIVIGHGPVIEVGDMDAAHIHDRAVIEVSTAAPVTTLESNTTIAESVVHAAVEANMRAPVAAVPQIDAITPTPVAGRPQQPGLRWEHPGARHPVIAVVTVSPVAGAPDIAGRWKRRLHIHRQHRRRYVDRHANGNAGV
jgi:hypothetical protein